MAKINSRDPQKNSISRRGAFLRPRFLSGLFRLIYSYPLQLLKFNPKLLWLCVLILFLLIFILVGTLIPSLQPFEGSLELNSLTFTGSVEQIFLKNVTSIERITARNPLPLTFTGTFNGDNPDLKTLKTITLKPVETDGVWWEIKAGKNAPLEIKELKITADTTIEHLEYDPSRKRLSIEKITPSRLAIDASNTAKFTVTFQGYQIPRFPEVTSFQWTPDNPVTLAISQPIELEIDLTKTLDRSPFWGRLEVHNVKFFQKPNISQEDFSENYQESAIAGGTLRLADKNATLEDGQFLTFSPTDSIRFLTRLGLATESANTLKTSDNQSLKITEPFQGLKVDISGKTKRIDIGLNPSLPILKLQASLLEGWMSREVFIALIAFLSTLVATLIGWFLEIILLEK